MLRLIHEKITLLIPREHFHFAECAEGDKMIAIHCAPMAVFLCRVENYEIAKKSLELWLTFNRTACAEVDLKVKEFAQVAQPKIAVPGSLPPGTRFN